MFLRNGFNVRLTSAHIIIGTHSVKSSLRRYWSSVSLKPPLLQTSSPKTYKREREGGTINGHNFIGICETKISIWRKSLNSAVSFYRKGTVGFCRDIAVLRGDDIKLRFLFHILIRNSTCEFATSICTKTLKSTIEAASSIHNRCSRKKPASRPDSREWEIEAMEAASLT